MADDEEQPASLLDLPDPCLLAVLRGCDQHSLFSAARAHSRLHQAAEAALISVAAGKFQRQQQADAVRLYLAKHGQHVSSVDLSADYSVTLRRLPPNLQLHSLKLSGFYLQLQPGDGWQGVLGPGQLPTLKQLRLKGCVLLAGDEGLEATLEQLADRLQHLSLSEELHDDRPECPSPDLYGSGLYESASSFDPVVRCRASVLQGMQQLTSLDLSHMLLVGPNQRDSQGDALQALQALTRLVELRLDLDGEIVSAGLLSGMSHLTRLEVSGQHMEPAVLAGCTQLRHLVLRDCRGLEGVGDWAAQLLSRLQPLQQLTHLSLPYSLTATPSPPAAAYSALTASSRLQQLEIRGATLPVGAWAHVFPTGRQLLQLTSLDLVGVHPPQGENAAALEGSRLVSCCPALRCLQLYGSKCSVEVTAALQGLTGLSTLLVFAKRMYVPVSCLIGAVTDERWHAQMLTVELLQLTVTH